MRFAIAVHGTRGDVEPCVAVAVELRSRGHEVRFGAPPDHVAFVESAGIPTVAAYGPDSHAQVRSNVFHTWYQPRNPVAAFRDARDYATDGWQGMGDCLMGLAEGADIVVTGTTYEEVAANVAEARRLPLASLHSFPLRMSSHLFPRIPPPLIRPMWAAVEWGQWQLVKRADDLQRRRLGLAESRVRSARRIVDSDALEIQAYDAALFPGLVEEWGPRFPIVGSLTVQQPTAWDDAALRWITDGAPPVCVGFGSMHVQAESVRAVIDACLELGERVLFVGRIPLGAPAERVMVVPAVRHSVVLPSCRAFVHHGGSGTTGAGLRAALPTLILWVGAEAPIWGAAVRRLGVGESARLSSATSRSAHRLLTKVLSPDVSTRAVELSRRMILPSDSVTMACDLLEDRARLH